MAGAGTGDLAELKRLDPNNVEEWTLVQPSWLNGDLAWKFNLQPLHQRNQLFQFLAFRDPTRQNEWQVSPIYPNSDNDRGHGPHMVSTHIGGITIPVICGPEGRTHPSMSSLRLAAAKWTLYTSCKMAGLNPGFSE